MFGGREVNDNETDTYIHHNITSNYQTKLQKDKLGN